MEMNKSEVREDEREYKDYLRHQVSGLFSV